MHLKMLPSATISPMKTIGFVSDTHGTLDPAAYAALADCDVIIHAGDIGRPSVLTELRCLAPTIAVLGNNDFPEYGSDVDYFAMPEIEGVHFLVGHEPKDVQPMAFPKRLRPGDPIPDVIVHGHVHYPRLEWGASVRPAKLLLCPGSVFRPRNGSVRAIGKMQVEDGRILRAWIEDLKGHELMTWPAA